MPEAMSKERLREIDNRLLASQGEWYAIKKELVAEVRRLKAELKMRTLERDHTNLTADEAIAELDEVASEEH